MRCDIITLGSATLDIFAKSDSKLIKIFEENSKTDLLSFPTGSKLLIDELVYTLGGGGTNSAAAFAMFGLKTSFLGRVGRDHNGDLILDYLKQHKIGSSLISRGNAPSGMSIILDNKKKDRVILTHKGINDSLSSKHFRLKDLSSDWFYSSSLIGESFNSLIKISKYIKKNNFKLAFNPSFYQVKRGIKFLSPVLKNTFVLILNLEEAKTLTKKFDLEKIFKTLLDIGPKVVAITNGKKGIFVCDNRDKKENKQILFLSSPKVKVVDTTGAGDAFGSAFVTGLMKNKNIGFCLKAGVENAVSVIQVFGAKNGLLNWPFLLKSVRKNKTKIKIIK